MNILIWCCNLHRRENTRRSVGMAASAHSWHKHSQESSDEQGVRLVLLKVRLEMLMLLQQPPCSPSVWRSSGWAADPVLGCRLKTGARRAAHGLCLPPVVAPWRFIVPCFAVQCGQEHIPARALRHPTSEPLRRGGLCASPSAGANQQHHIDVSTAAAMGWGSERQRDI